MYRIETLFTYGWGPVDEEVYDTFAQAQADLDDLIIGCSEYIDDFDPDQWRIVEVEST